VEEMTDDLKKTDSQKKEIKYFDIIMYSTYIIMRNFMPLNSEDGILIAQFQSYIQFFKKL
jgi:hypothetical protein